MDQTLQNIITLITMIVGVLGITLNYVKRSDDVTHSLHTDLVTDLDRIKKERDDLLVAKAKWELERDTLQAEMYRRDQALAQIALQSVQPKKEA